jgi:DNA-nicking Smr family endonuclease
MKTRFTSEAERREFERNFAERRPIRAVPAKPAPPRKTAASAPSGVNGATRDRLRRGLVEPDARLDLHGMTETVAHRTLHVFLHAAHGRGLRLVLVVTGKGNPAKTGDAVWMRAPHGVLKQMVPRWLNQPGPAALIAYIQVALARHGGDGAL